MNGKTVFSVVLVSIIYIANSFHRPCAENIRYLIPTSMNRDDSCVPTYFGHTKIKVLVLHKLKVLSIDYGYPTHNIDLFEFNDELHITAISQDSIDLCNSKSKILSDLMNKTLYDLLRMNLLRRSYSQIPIESYFLDILQLYKRLLNSESVESKSLFSRKKKSKFAALQYILEFRKIRKNVCAIKADKYY
jgi:hypothetical protein